MENLKLDGLELMGNNVRDKLKYCGKDVRIYPLAKIARPEVVELDDNCQIFDFVFIYGSSIKIGKYTIVSYHCLIDGWADACIGDRVLIAPGVKIITSMNEYEGYRMVDDDLPDTKLYMGKVTIGDDAYIGANCVILPKSTIPDGTIIGANSLVTKGKVLEPWSIYIGSPCKKIGEREKPKL